MTKRRRHGRGIRELPGLNSPSTSEWQDPCRRPGRGSNRGRKIPISPFVYRCLPRRYRSRGSWPVFFTAQAVCVRLVSPDYMNVSRTPDPRKFRQSFSANMETRFNERNELFAIFASRYAGAKPSTRRHLSILRCVQDCRVVPAYSASARQAREFTRFWSNRPRFHFLHNTDCHSGRRVDITHLSWIDSYQS